VGSYKGKYERTVIAVNALLGVTAGADFTPAGGPPGAAIGLFTPVGLHVTTPIADHWLHVGAMLSVIDLGALTSTRLGGSSAIEKSPNVGFAQIFSPGLFATLGIAKAPVVIGGGAVTPSLRAQDLLDTNNKVTGTTTVPSIRVEGFIAFDLPVLEL
jgi:hypothetical protein